jgi:hypothetical protein
MMGEVTAKMEEYETAIREQFDSQIRDLEAVIQDLRRREHDRVHAQTTREIGRLNEEILASQLKALQKKYDQ